MILKKLLWIRCGDLLSSDYKKVCFSHSIVELASRSLYYRGIMINLNVIVTPLKSEFLNLFVAIKFHQNHMIQTLMD